MKIGNLDINNVKLGDTQIKKVMLGDNLIWENFNKLLGAVGVYSLKKIVPTYQGNAIRIRRCSDNQETDIGFDVNGNLDISAINTFVGNYRNLVKNTNLIAYSPTNYFWNYQQGTSSSIIYTTGQADAFGGNNGTKITSSVTTIPMIGASSTVPSLIEGTVVTISVHCKAVESNIVRVGEFFGNVGRVDYNLSTQTATYVGSNVINHSITSVGNGWFRVSSTFPFSNQISNSYLYGGFGCNTVANGVDGMLFSHPQIEFGDLTSFQENLFVQTNGGSNQYFYTVKAIYDQSKKNLIEYSEPTNNSWNYGGSGGVTYENFAGWTGLPFTNCVRFNGGSTTRHIYNAQGVQGKPLTYSFYIIMDDLSEPQIGGVNDVTKDFIIYNSLANPAPIITKINLGNGIWRIEAYQPSFNVNNAGIVKYLTQSTKGFRVTGFQCEVGSVATSYEKRMGIFRNLTLGQQPTIVYNNEGVPYLANFGRDLKIETATNLSSVDGYTLYCNYRIDASQTSGQAKGIFTLFGGNAGNANNISRVRVMSTDIMSQEARFGGTITVNLQTGTSTAAINTYSKVAASFKIDNSRSYFNGTKMGEDLVGAVTDGNILVWGGFNGNVEPMNGFSNEFIIYNEDKDDEFLNKLTEL